VSLEKGSRVKIGLPKDYPLDMIENLKRHFAEEKTVRTAYLLWMVRGEEGSFLLVLKTNRDKQIVIPKIGELCWPYLRGRLLDIISLDTAFAQSVTDGLDPFYNA
jgi:hypothetical protein